MVGRDNWVSVARLEALIAHCLNGLINIGLTDLDTLEFFILQIHLVNFINNVSWLIGIVSDPPEVFFRVISLILSLVSVDTGSNGRLADARVSGEIAIDSIGSGLAIGLTV